MGKRVIGIVSGALAASLAFAGLQSIGVVGASEAQAADCGDFKQGVAFGSGVDATIKRTILGHNAADTINKIKAIREEAYNENLPLADNFQGKKFTLGKLQDYLQQNGISKEQYINGFVWSAQLEKASIVRASEVMMAFEHKRPDGTFIMAEGALIPGKNVGENIAYSGASITDSNGVKTMSGINLNQALEDWTEGVHKLKGSNETFTEHQNYRNQSGPFGHYSLLISPSIKAIGMSAVDNMSVLNVQRESATDNTPLGISGICDVPIKLNPEWVQGQKVGETVLLPKAYRIEFDSVATLVDPNANKQPAPETKPSEGPAQRIADLTQTLQNTIAQAQPGVVKNDVVKNDVVKNDVVKNDVVKNDVVKNDVVKNNDAVEKKPQPAPVDAQVSSADKVANVPTGPQTTAPKVNVEDTNNKSQSNNGEVKQQNIAPQKQSAAGSTSANSTPAQQAGKTSEAVIKLGKSAYEPGETVSYELAGFTPNSKVTVVLHSTPVTVGVVQADANGAATGSFVIPAGFTGAHTLIATDEAGKTAQIGLTIENKLASTGSAVNPLTITGALAMVLLGAAGIVLTVLRRRA